MSKPTMQDIAAALSVSRISVWKALNNKPGVSDALRVKIYNLAKDIGYVRHPPTDMGGANGIATRPTTSVKNIAVVVSKPESSHFWMQIIHEIAKELSFYGANLMYTYMPTRYEDGDCLPASLADASLSGIIVLNIYSEPQLKMLAGLSLPKVFLDTVPSMPFHEFNGDVVFIEGRLAVKQITGHLLDSGQRRLGFVGDVNYAQTNMDRFHGFLEAHTNRGMTVDETFNLTIPLHAATHYNQISAFLHGLSRMPDGFVCASDYIAHFIQEYFNKNGISNDQVCLTGFDNNTEYANVANKITTVNVQTRSLGKRLANKIMFAVNYPDSTHEICYETTKVLFRP